MSDRVTLRTGRFWLDDEGFLRGECFEGAEETLADAEEQIRQQRTMGDGTRRPFLMNISRVRSLSREARSYFSNSDASLEVFSCTALVVGSPLSRAVGNFFIGLNKPRMTTRLFTSEEEGLAWLREQASAPTPNPREGRR
jgi:hypothetical protein